MKLSDKIIVGVRSTGETLKFTATLRVSSSVYVTAHTTLSYPVRLEDLEDVPRFLANSICDKLRERLDAVNAEYNTIRALLPDIEEEA